MVMHRCDDFRSTYSHDGEKVDANSSSEVTRYGAKSCGYEAFAFTGKSNGTRFIENVSHHPPTDLLTILLVALSKQARDHHEKSNPNLTHILCLLSDSDFDLGFVENRAIVPRPADA